MESFKTISKSEGYKSLKAVILRDIARARESAKRGYSDGCGVKLYTNSGKNQYSYQFKWIIDRAKHYSHKTGLSVSKILTAWEKDRNYWYMNYYQNANQPKIKGKNILVVESREDLRPYFKKGFRCPACGGVSLNPTRCNSEVIVEGRTCDWKAYGFLGTLGKGLYVFPKDVAVGTDIFMPIVIEEELENKK